MRPLQYGYGACWSIWSWVVQDLLCVQICEQMFSRHESRWAKYFNCKSWGSTWLQGFSRRRIWSWRFPRNAYPVKLLLIEKRMLVKIFWFEPALKLASSGTFAHVVSMFGLLVIKKVYRLLNHNCRFKLWNSKDKLMDLD